MNTPFTPPALACILLATTALPAQQHPRLAPLGTAHPPSATAPSLQVEAVPLLGQPIRIDVRGGEPQQFGFLAIGAAATQPLVLPTGHPIHVPLPSAVIAVSLNSAGERRSVLASAPLPPAMLGVNLAVQGAFFGASIPTGFTTTRAVAYRLAAPVAGPLVSPTSGVLAFARRRAARLVTDLEGNGIQEILSISGPTVLESQSADGEGGFTVPVGIDLTAAAAQLDLQEVDGGDIDGDGITDLVLANGAQQEVVVAFGLGDGSFPTGLRLAAPGVVQTCRLADVDGDGDLDVLAGTRPATGPDRIEVWTNTAAGLTTSSSPVFAIPRAGTATVDQIHAVDLDQDGLMDLVCIQAPDWISLGGQLSVAFGTAPGAFSLPRTIPLPQAARGTTFADIDQDGFPEMICGLDAARNAFGANTSTHLGAVIWGTNDRNQWGTNPLLVTGDAGLRSGVVVSDMTGDGQPEVAWSANDGRPMKLDPRILVHQVAPNRHLLQIDAISVDPAGPLLMVNAAPGLAPAVVSIRDTAFAGEAVVFARKADGSLRTARETTLLTAPEAQAPFDVEIADFTGDGLADIWLTWRAIPRTSQNNSTFTRLLVGHGDGTFGDSPMGTLAEANAGTRSGLRTDFDRDGTPELLLHTTDAGDSIAPRLQVLRADAQGQVTVDPPIPTGLIPASGVEFNTCQVMAADFDRNGTEDILFCARRTDTTTGTSQVDLHWLPGDGIGGFLPPVIQPAVALPADFFGASTAADLNRDGELDIVIRGGMGLHTSLGLGGGAFGPFTTTAAPGFGPIQDQNIFALDVDGDGNLDVIGTGARESTDPITSMSAFAALGSAGGSLGAANRVRVDATLLRVADLEPGGQPEILFLGRTIDWLPATSFRPDLGTPLTTNTLRGQSGNSVWGFGDLDGDGLTDVFSYPVFARENPVVFLHPNQRGGLK